MAEPCGESELSNKQKRLGDCEVCATENAQYTCPRCELKTCSLKCVKIHKKELDCEGDRDKTAFVPLPKFDNLTVLSDYRFLEDISRTVDNCRRDPLKRSTRVRKQLPTHLFRLKQEAAKRKTNLLYLPQHFTRHKENTTILHFKSGVIYWRLEFIFPQANHVRIVEEKCDENTRLSTVLAKYLEVNTCPELYQSHLRFYHSKGCAGIEALLKAENAVPSPSFFVLDMDTTFKENLENRIIIENPTIYIIDKDHKDEYNILDPDLEFKVNRPDNKSCSDFTPFNYYDTIRYERKDKNSDHAKSILASAKELRTYFGGGDVSYNDSDDNEDEVAVVPEKKSFNGKKKYKPFNIPQYEDLIKKSSE